MSSRSVSLVSVALIAILVINLIPASAGASVTSKVISWMQSSLDSGSEGASSAVDRPVAKTPTIRPKPPKQVIPKPPQAQPEEPSVTLEVGSEKSSALTSVKGDVRVSFPQGALTEKATVTYTPMPPAVSDTMVLFKVFNLEASSSLTSAPITRFAKDLQIDLTYTDADIAGMDARTLKLYYFDEGKSRWLPVPSTVDEAERRISGTTDHFTVYGGGATPAYSLPGTIMSFQTSLATGSSTASYPLELPDGPGGLKPNLTLVYNSGGVDEMKNARDVGSWVGLGWTLHTSRISYNEDESTYNMEFDGGSYELILGTDEIYRIQDKFWKVTKPNDTTFEMWDNDGTHYIFGGTSGSVQYRYKSTGNINYRYDLRLIEDTHGNQISISYSQDIWPATNSSVRSAYPSEITYGAVHVYFNSSFDITGNPTDGNLRNDNPRSFNDPVYGDHPAPEIMENKKLDSVVVKVGTSQVRKYQFGYTTTASSELADDWGTYGWIAGRHTLTSITQYGTDTTTLPAMTFSYQNKTTRYYNASGTAVVAFSWPHLYQVNSGFGGTVTYTYAERPASSARAVWTREVVTVKSVNPGVGPVQTTNYTYVGTPKQVIDPATPDYSNTVYRGYDQVEEADAAGNVVRHYFYANGYYRVELPLGGYVEQWAAFYPGREYRTEWVEKGTVVKAVFKDWQYCDFDDGHMQRPILWGAGEIQGDKISWTSYQYDDYGNVIVEQRDPDVNESGGESATIRTFYPNTTDWIVNKVARVSTYDSPVDEEDPDGIGLVERTYYYYDGSTDFTASPSLGDLTMTMRALSASVSGPTSYFEYDSYGNLTDETDPNGNTTSHTYDSTYHTYPVGKTYPEIPGSPPLQMTESYEWDYVLGKPLSETDVNGQTTSYVYDTLGRRTKEMRPGDDSTYPTVRYTYVSWGTLSSQNVKMEQKVASNDYQWQKTYFDGLGRVLQVQERAESSQSIVSSTTAYNSRGQVDKKYISWLLGSEQSTYQTPSSSLQYTSYEYDVLGRATSVKNADGTRTGTDFMAPLAQSTTDAKGSKKKYAYDGLGNMTQVGEYDLAPAYLSQFGNSGQLSNPQGMTAVRGWLTIVADTGNNNILKYQGGTLKATVGTYGSGSGQFNGPYDVEASGDGLYYYVADTGNNRISQWSNKVFPLSQFGTYGKEIGQLNSPNGIAANSAVSYIYVADTYNNRIEQFTASTGAMYRKWGTYGTGNYNFDAPYDVALDGSGNVYVVDNGNNRIMKYNSSGGYVSQWGSYGTGNSQFDSPRAITFGNNYIYVVDTLNYRVQYFNTSGVYQGYWGSEGTGTSQFLLPTGIAVGPDGAVYVADFGGIQKFSSTGTYVSRILNDSDIEGQQWVPQHIAVDGSSNLYVTDWANRVLVFASGSFVESFGKTGSDLGELNAPMGIYYDRTNNKVYLADSWNHRVQKFEASTKVVRTWGSSGSGNGQFSAPKGVGIDDSGNVYVADTNNNRVQKFTPDGAYSTKWGSSGSGDGQFNHPWDVAVDFNGNVYVADKDNNRVQKFDTSGTFVAKWTVTAPTRIAIDGAGYVYVSDPTNNRMQKFTPDGTLLLSLGSSGTGNGQFNSPQGIAFAGDSLSELQVVDSGNTRVQTFDALGTLYSTTTYAYDVRGNMTQVVDDASNTTDISYNFLSQKTEMSDPDLGTWSYTYDDNGNLATQTDALDQTLAFSYDPLNRMLEKRTPDLEGTLLASFSYDSVSDNNYGRGLRTGMTDVAGTVTYKYDTRSRTIREDRVIDSTTYTTQYTYDPADRLATVTYPTNEVVTQTYSPRNLPYSVSGSVAGTLVSSAAYNQLGQMSQIDLGNGLRTVFNYFGIDTLDGGDSSSYFGKLYRIKTYVSGWGFVRQHQKYWWDADGNLSTRTDAEASETESFSYDFLDRLTGVSGAYSESYAYNEIGNMTSKNGTSYTYGSSAGPHAVTGVGNYTQTYDDNGNMIGRVNATGTQTLDWNVENQLYQVEGTGGGYSGTATYTYDGDGNRIKKVEGNTTTVYVNKYYERSIVNNTTTNTSYYYLGGKLVATKKGSTLEFLHQDSLSSTALTTNSSGSQVSATKYLPFGSTRSSSGTLSTSRMFTSQHMDSSSDLYFYNARYYDATLGRFISPDTIVPGASEPQAFNRYSYVLNNPLKYTDPSGHAVSIGEDDGGNPIWMDDDGDLSTAGTIPGAGAPPVQTVAGVTNVDTNHQSDDGREVTLGDAIVGSLFISVGVIEGGAAVGLLLSNLIAPEFCEISVPIALGAGLNALSNLDTGLDLITGGRIGGWLNWLPLEY